MRRNVGIANEKGLTLVEILASLIIISLLIISFLTLFGQTARQNMNSEKVMDATYTAQKQMENIYLITQQSTFEKGLEIMENKYGKYIKENIDNRAVYNFNQKVEGLDVDITLVEPKENNKTGKLTVKVYEEDRELRAQMETILLWRD